MAESAPFVPAQLLMAVLSEKSAFINTLTGVCVVISIQLTDVFQAEVAELVYALDLGSSTARCESSSLFFRTKFIRAVFAMCNVVMSSNVRTPRVSDSNRMMRNYYARIY